MVGERFARAIATRDTIPSVSASDADTVRPVNIRSRATVAIPSALDSWMNSGIAYPIVGQRSKKRNGRSWTRGGPLPALPVSGEVKDRKRDERQVGSHLAQLAAMSHQAGDAVERLQAVLEAYAFMRHEGRDSELAALLHHGPHLAHAEQHLRDLVQGVIASGAKAGELRDDIPADELATFCLHALSAANDLRSKPAVHRLVQVTLAGLRPERRAKRQRAPR